MPTAFSSQTAFILTLPIHHQILLPTNASEAKSNHGADKVEVATLLRSLVPAPPIIPRPLLCSPISLLCYFFLYWIRKVQIEHVHWIQ